MQSIRSIAIHLLLLAAICSAASTTAPSPIVWDSKSLVLIQAGGGYGRMIRTTDGLVCCFEFRGSIWIRFSEDEGLHWNDPLPVAGFEFGHAANPELLNLHNGRLLCFYNARPYDGKHAYSIEVAESADHGKTWATHPKSIFTAGTTNSAGCYEPAAIELDSGEIQLFFANEFPHRAEGLQEISLVRSVDGGATWFLPAAASFRAGGRDGMPVPLVLSNHKGMVVAIEDNGVTQDHEFKPAILRSAAVGQWDGDCVTADSPRRWPAVDAIWLDKVYAGAPYLRQMPSGQTVLSCQCASAGTGRRMTVYVGDAEAKHFVNPTEPFPTDAGREGLWNALFVKNDSTITAISTTTIHGVTGIWVIDGHLAKSVSR